MIGVSSLVMLLLIITNFGPVPAKQALSQTDNKVSGDGAPSEETHKRKTENTLHRHIVFPNLACMYFVMDRFYTTS